MCGGGGRLSPLVVRLTGEVPTDLSTKSVDNSQAGPSADQALMPIREPCIECMMPCPEGAGPIEAA